MRRLLPFGCELTEITTEEGIKEMIVSCSELTYKDVTHHKECHHYC